MKKTKNVWKKFALQNPKNLEREVHIYGYHYSWRAHSISILGTLVGSWLLGFVFQLQVFCTIVIAAAATFVLPMLVLDMYKRMYEQKRFADAAAYMEQMLYSFQKTGKVTGALKETREIFSDGRMRQCMDEAIVHMELGVPKTTQGVLAEGLLLIEERYRCTKLMLVHEFLQAMESYGGAAEETVLLILEDIENWKKREYQLQAEKKKYHTDNVISIVVSVILCAVALYVLEGMGQMFQGSGRVDIFSLPVIQLSSTVFILLLLKILVKSMKGLTEDWLNESEKHAKEYVQHSYDMVMHYEKETVHRWKLWVQAGVLAMAFLLLLAGAVLPAVIGMAAAGVFLGYRRLGYRLAKKDVTEAMYLALPQWLMELLLLLQNNNVQVALMKSVAQAPAALQQELAALRDRIQERPGDLQTYTAFCSSFDLPEIHGCMKMLHAFSENGTGNLREQMNRLLERVERMQEAADVIRNDRIAFQMKMIFSYPVLSAIGKLLIDLTVGMAVMLQVLGSMGGV